MISSPLLVPYPSDFLNHLSYAHISAKLEEEKKWTGKRVVGHYAKDLIGLLVFVSL